MFASFQLNIVTEVYAKNNRMRYERVENGASRLGMLIHVFRYYFFLFAVPSLVVGYVIFTLQLISVLRLACANKTKNENNDKYFALYVKNPFDKGSSGCNLKSRVFTDER